MKKISSRATAFHKKFFPLLWFGVLAFAFVVGLQKGRLELLWMPVLMAVLGFVIMRKFVWDMVDEVYDGGDYLLIRKGGEEERIPLNNIMNVNASINANPPRVTLRLVKPGKFGSEVTFTPRTKVSFLPFRKNPIVEDLIVRVDRARRA